MSSPLDDIEDPDADALGLLVPTTNPYNPPEIAPRTFPDPGTRGIVQPDLREYREKHRARLELQAAIGAIVALLLVIVLTFAVFLVNSERTEPDDVLQAAAIFLGPVLAVLGYAFGRHRSTDR